MVFQEMADKGKAIDTSNEDRHEEIEEGSRGKFPIYYQSEILKKEVLGLLILLPLCNHFSEWCKH